MSFRRKLLFGSTAFLGTMTIYNLYKENFTSPEYLIYQKYPHLRDFDLKEKKVTRFLPDSPEELSEEEKLFSSRCKSVKWNLDWESNSEVLVTKFNEENFSPKEETGHKSISLENGEVHVYVGGIQSLFACVKKLESLEKDNLIGNNIKCIFMNDGKALIAQRAGMQLHEHPTQYPDYNYLQLFKKLFQSLYILPKDHPERYDYSPLHYDLKCLIKEPINATTHYLALFFNKVWHSLTSKRRVSNDDYNLILLIRQSINYMQELDGKIQKEIGKSIINRNGRIYWSPDKIDIDKKKDHWSAMGIPIEDITGEDINAITLLRGNKKIYAIRMPNDGEVHPNLPEIVIEYLLKKYPNNFEYHVSALSTIYTEDNSTNVKAITEKKDDGTQNSYPVSSLYCSLGHHDVHGAQSKKRQFYLIPASGVTSDWKVSISKERLLHRVDPELKKKGMTLEQYLKKGLLVPSADMYNLHVKFIDYHMDDSSDTVTFFMRVTEGANLFSSYSEKRDLINITYKLNKYFVGDWKIITAGTCTRQSSVANRPEIHGPFHFGQCGVGISLSGGEHTDEIFNDTPKDKMHT